jgi:hypothetical protein
MASYTLSQSITVEQFEEADDADALIANVEGSVIAALGGDRGTEPVEGDDQTPRGEISTEWFTVITGDTAADTDDARRTQSQPWNPTDDEVPEGVDFLVCHGTRTT